MEDVSHKIVFRTERRYSERSDEGDLVLDKWSRIHSSNQKIADGDLVRLAIKGTVFAQKAYVRSCQVQVLSVEAPAPESRITDN
jgi:hypothetical protein